MLPNSNLPITNNSQKSKRLCVLISAYACEPGKGSEPAVGWNTAVHMAKHHDVWVLTRSNNRATVEAELRKNPVSGLQFVYYDLPLWAMWWKKGGRGVQLYYYLWEFLSVRIVQKLEAQAALDLVHHVTIVRYWTPSNLRNAKAPLVWGPVGGGETTPAGMKKNFSIKNRIIESVRDLVRRGGELDPLVRRTARKSSVAIATTDETAQRLHHLGVEHVEIISQLGVSQTIVTNPSGGSFQKHVRFICIGKQIYWKGFDLAIKAFAKAELDDAELILVGSGAEHKRLRRMAVDLGIQNRVCFLEWMDQAALYGLLSECDVLVHPSFHDSGAFVCLEAMSFGKPVICLDLGGPAVQVTEETGIKVPAKTLAQVVSDIASAMRTLVADSELRSRMGASGRKRVEEHFLWPEKAKAFCQIYESVLEETGRCVR